jgi:hypothetical protein
MEIRIYEVQVVCGVREDTEPEEQMFLIAPNRIIFLGKKTTKENPEQNWLKPDEIQRITQNCQFLQEVLLEIQNEIEERLVFSSKKQKSPSLQLSLFGEGD